LALSAAGETFEAVAGGKPKAEIVVDMRGASETNGPTLLGAGQWLADCLKQSSGAELPVLTNSSARPAIVVARADQYPEVAAGAAMATNCPDAFCVVHVPPRLYVLGSSELGARHGVAAILHRLGFRWYAPMPKWWITPALRDVSIEAGFADRPALVCRRIYYTPSWTKDPVLLGGFERWVAGNRLTGDSLFNVGHSYAGIVGRNKQAFAEHPEYFAAGSNGVPDLQRKIEGRKFCTSNPELIALVIADRIRMWEQVREKDPAEYMISADPSDGPGICECERCRKLGNPTDRCVSLANHVARALREKHPGAWVGMYAYGYHLEPPTIPVESNIYVQVAMGYNFTDLSLPELVDAWSRTVTQLGLREYYGIVGSDWGLPGRVRCGSVEYHRQWIPYYAQRKVNAINAQTDAFWGAQMLGLCVAARLMWDPGANAGAIADDYYRNCFGPGAVPMRQLQARFDAKPGTEPADLLPMLKDVETACALATGDPAVLARVADMMAYLHYVVLFNEFRRDRPARALSKGYLPEDHDDAYYASLRAILEYLWQTQKRGMADVRAFAARTCDGWPRRDNRMDFYVKRGKAKAGQTDPVWMRGKELTDPEVVALFRADLDRLARDALKPRRTPAAGAADWDERPPDEEVP
jgi:hypothetical protein